MTKKIAIYTAIFGNFNKLIKQPNYKNVDCICYTDQDIPANGWKVIKVTPPVVNDNTRSNRYYKILPHKHLKDYDVSIYIDGNILVFNDVTQLISNKLKTASFACFDHNQNVGDPRDCIYKEYEAILDLGKKKNKYKDDPKVMKKQMERFRAEGYPENNGLITAPVLIRRHHDKELMNVMENWWAIVKNESKRDQLSFNYVAWKLNYTNYEIIDNDVRRGNPWFRTFSHKKSNLKIFIFKLKNKLGLI